MDANERIEDQNEAGCMAEAVPEKIRELAKFLEVDTDEIEETNWNTYEVGNEEYRVLTDEEADEATEIYISETVWAFQPWFIIEHSNLPYEAKEMIESFQRDKCEGANETILALIEDFDEFVKGAISADGRGHFLAGYDFEENKTENFYIYRVN